MATITAIQPQKQDKNRVNIYLDGQFAMGLTVAVATQLKVGQLLTEESLAELNHQELFEKARLTAEEFLSYRPRSISEVRQNLLKKEVTETVVEQVLANLGERGLLDDLAFAQYWIDQRESFKPRSPFALRQELREKGVESAVIEEALEEIDKLESARRAAEGQANRWSHLPWESFQQKLGRFLHRRGFDYGTVRQVSKEIWSVLHPHSDDGSEWID